jgi:hypothetical protein
VLAVLVLILIQHGQRLHRQVAHLATTLVVEAVVHFQVEPQALQLVDLMEKHLHLVTMPSLHLVVVVVVLTAEAVAVPAATAEQASSL